jgi:hypothetical protein
MAFEETLSVVLQRIASDFDDGEFLGELATPFVVLLMAETLDGCEIQTDGTRKVTVLEDGHFEDDCFA